MKQLIFIFSLLILTFGGKKEEKINPFDLSENQPPITNNPVLTVDANSFAGLHKNIFNNRIRLTILLHHLSKCIALNSLVPNKNISRSILIFHLSNFLLS